MLQLMQHDDCHKGHGNLKCSTDMELQKNMKATIFQRRSINHLIAAKRYSGEANIRKA